MSQGDENLRPELQLALMGAFDHLLTLQKMLYENRASVPAWIIRHVDECVAIVDYAEGEEGL